MIINSLTLHNFMSYADARLDLTQVSVACLTGLNGAGKSALLDAITWALWEAARASSDEIIRLGQSDMWVDLCFSLEQQVYRVRRARQKSFGKSGQQNTSRPSLDLQVWDGSYESWLAKNTDDTWKSLNAGSIRETQKRLRELLRMDYETFISSVYLRQGRADEFTMRSPNERKQVFADILGLDYFDKLQEMAREEARERKGRIQVLEAGLNSKSDFEQDYNDSCADIESLNSETALRKEEFESCVARQSHLESEIAKLNYLQIRAETARMRSTELRTDLESLTRRADELQLQEAKLKLLLEQSDLVCALFRQFEECKSLAESLDLKASKYGELFSRRLELRSKIGMFQGRLEVESEHLKATLQAKHARLVFLEKNCSDADKLESAFHEYRRLLDAELEMSKKRESFSALSMRADELHSMITESRVRLEAQIQQKESLLLELEQLIAARSQMENEQDYLLAELSSIDQVEAEFELVEEKGFKVKSQIETFQQQIIQLKKVLRENEDKVHELCQTPDLSSCPLCRAPIVDRKAVLDRYQKDSENSKIDMDNIENQIQQLTDEREHLRKQYVELRTKLEQRKVVDMKIGQYNERKAAVVRAVATRDEFKRELDQLCQRLEMHSFAQVEKESLVRVKAELSKLEFDPIVFSSFQAQMRSQRHIEIRYQQMQRDLKELSELKTETPALEERLKQMEFSLQSGNYAPDERAEIEQMDAAISELSYDKFAHQELKHKLGDLLPYADKAKDIERAQAEIPELSRASSETTAMVLARKQELLRLDEETEEWSHRLDDLPRLKEESEQQAVLRQRFESELDELKQRRMQVETRLHQFEQYKTDIDSKRKTLAENIQDLNEYNTLAESFGKKGIQAIIIENAIPEIEAEANRILSRLTDNQMHLALLTQQRTRQGNPIETLEILIADELGTRAYELYSGGEAFKVNFALRVAMSRLLARRAGAKLETLIIDEGFGSQDENSRDKMIQAIASIKPDFARIIVVTHLADVKDMFPTHIFVRKEDGVSSVSLLS